MFRVYIIDMGRVYYLTGWLESDDGEEFPVLSMDPTEAIQYRRFSEAHRDLKQLTDNDSRCFAHIEGI